MAEQTKASDGCLIRAFQYPEQVVDTLAQIPRNCYLCTWVPRIGYKDDKPIIQSIQLKFASELCEEHGALVR